MVTHHNSTGEGGRCTRFLPEASERGPLTAVTASVQHPEPEDPLTPFSATPIAQRAPQEAKASAVCLLQRKYTFLAKVRGHVLKALVASARALPQGILARLRGHCLVAGPYPQKDVLMGSLSGLVFPIKREGYAVPAFSPGCEQSPESRETHAAPRTC